MASSSNHRCENSPVERLANGRPRADGATPVVGRSAGRIALVALVAILMAQPATASTDDLAPEQREADFDVLWRALDQNYAYFDAKQADWAAVRAIYRPRVREVKNGAEFVGLLEQVLEELYDSHTHLNTNTASSPRLVPSGADVWAEWRGDKALVLEVRPGSPAARAGLRPGVEIVSYDGKPIAEAVRARLGRSLRKPDPAARDWALRTILAGRRDEDRALVVRSGKDERVVVLKEGGDHRPEGANEDKPISHRKLAGEIGYIRINDALGRNETVAAFDAALADLKDTKGLIIDLRDTPSGGISTVARGLMGRLIDREATYQKHALPQEERDTGVRRSWLEIVSPRGPFTYTAPVVVLVDHWTGSMGEGIAIGLDGAKRARVVGTPMAALLGAKSSETLPNSRIAVSFAAEKLYHVDGTPREDYRPKVEVDLLKAGEGAEDPILEAGLKELASKPR